MAILRSSATRIGCTALSIPTCSGISHFHQLRRILRTVAPRHWSAWLYPRSRGENTLRTNDLPAVYGSSPLTRGKCQHHHERPRDRRLIPAHAGKMTLSHLTSSLTRAHPRSRGENLLHEIATMGTVGSSPLTRGKLSRCAGSPASQGLIPAHAGKMYGRARRASPTRAHPRSRGENWRVSPVSPRWVGSSPLTRGKYH